MSDEMEAPLLRLLQLRPWDIFQPALSSGVIGSRLNDVVWASLDCRAVWEKSEVDEFTWRASPFEPERFASLTAVICQNPFHWKEAVASFRQNSRDAVELICHIQSVHFSRWRKILKSVDPDLKKRIGIACRGLQYSKIEEICSIGLRPTKWFDPQIKNAQVIRKNDLSLLSESIERTVGDGDFEWSVIIPSYAHLPELKKTLAALMIATEAVPQKKIEILVIDDGSPDETSTWLSQYAAEMPSLVRAYRWHRKRSRRWGDKKFRAASVRNLGARLSRGQRLLFLDADILCPPFLFNRLDGQFDPNGILQMRRWQLDPYRSPDPRQTDDWENFWQRIRIGPGSYWEDFQLDRTPWKEKPHPWKYVSSFGLAVGSALFKSIGGFCPSFDRYGFEDTELGYRLWKAGAEMRLADIDVLHQNRAEGRSEYGDNADAKLALLSASLPDFLARTLDLDSVAALGLRPPRNQHRNVIDKIRGMVFARF